MSDTFITIVAIIIAVILLFVVPIMAMGNQNDAITQTAVETVLSNFVNTAAREGQISKSNYDEFVQKLYATGNSYDISLEVQVMDANVVNKNGKAIGENTYYSVFKNDIEQVLKSGNTYNLKQGDRVIAKVQNTNVTFGTQFKNFVYSVMGKDTIAIEASSSALVSTTTK